MAILTTALKTPARIGKQDLGDAIITLQVCANNGVLNQRIDDTDLAGKFQDVAAVFAGAAVTGVPTFSAAPDVDDLEGLIITTFGAVNTKNGYYKNGALIPTLTGVAPATSAHATPTTVTFTGTNFPSPLPPTTSVSVKFSDGTVWANPTVVSATSITASATDATAAGAGTVTLTINDGINVTTLTQPYTFT